MRMLMVLVGTCASSVVIDKNELISSLICLHIKLCGCQWHWRMISAPLFFSFSLHHKIKSSHTPQGVPGLGNNTLSIVRTRSFQKLIDIYLRTCNFNLLRVSEQCSSIVRVRPFLKMIGIHSRTCNFNLLGLENILQSAAHRSSFRRWLGIHLRICNFNIS